METAKHPRRIPVLRRTQDPRVRPRLPFGLPDLRPRRRVDAGSVESARGQVLASVTQLLPDPCRHHGRDAHLDLVVDQDGKRAGRV